MSKSQSSSGQPAKRKSECAPRRGVKSARKKTALNLLEGLDSDKPARPALDLLRPFMKERIDFKMPSDFKYLDGVLDYLSERMLKMGIINSGDSEVLIALDEAIVNAIKHGNKCDPEKAVSIVAEFSPGGARFTVRDEGEGFARHEVPDPRDPSRLLEPSGRGLLLITHIMDEVCHNERGNEIQMFKRSPQEGQPDPHAPSTGRKQQ